jgi:hypothetical protein
MTDDLERAIGPDRRTFIKRLVVATAFAAPAVSSFTMSGVQAVFSGGRVMGIGNSNTTPPPGPDGYIEQLLCGEVTAAGLTLDVDDGDVHLHLEVPAGALPDDGSSFGGTIVCIYKGDLAALADDVPTGEVPVSAYAVVWNSPPSNDQPDAAVPLTLTVTNDVVEDGEPIYVFDKTTGDTTGAGTADDGTWEVTFVQDPAYVVTQVQQIPITPEPVANPASAVTAQPDFTG